MVYAVLAIGAIALVLLVVLVLAVGGLFRLPNDARYSNGEAFFLWAVGFAAAVSALVLGTTHGDAWWLIPVGAFMAAMLVTKSIAVGRRDRELEAERQRLAERQKRIEHRKQLECERIERLGKDGVKALARMKAAVDLIGGTEAAREGWLGGAGDISFSADLQLTEEQLAQVATFRTKIGEAKRMPHGTVADKQMVKDAETAVKKLERAVRERIKVIEACARKAEEVDRTLQELRRRADVAEQQDKLRGQLAAMLARIELTPQSRPSDSAEAVTARVEAFRELKDSIRPGVGGSTDASGETATDSSWQAAIGRLWPW